MSCSFYCFGTCLENKSASISWACVIIKVYGSAFYGSVITDFLSVDLLPMFSPSLALPMSVLDEPGLGLIGMGPNIRHALTRAIG